MKKIRFCLILLSATLVPNGCFEYTYEEKVVSVPLDHFTFSNDAKFNVRYLVNDSFWKDNGPVFLYAGHEGNAEVFARNTGLIWELAPEFGALVVFAEHRYYGRSLPFGKKSLSEPKFSRYLMSSQVLADFVYVINAIRVDSTNKTELKVPVVAFGGAYGGVLAAWLRMKYPDTALGAIASSAPIWLFQGLKPCDTYNKLMTSLYASYDQKCPKTVKISWEIIRNVTSNSDGKNWLSSNWKLCKPLNTAQDIETLITTLAEIYDNLALVNYPYESKFIVPLPAYPVRSFCDGLKNISLEPYEFLNQFRNALGVYVNHTGKVDCFETQFASADVGELGWNFQTCTELITPTCASEEDLVETLSYDYETFQKKCFDRWKIQPNRKNWAELQYGGLDLSSYSNIIFSNGLLDPYSGGAVLRNVSDSVLAYIISDGAHHVDLSFSNSLDPPSFGEARRFHAEHIRIWLETYYRKSNV